MADRSAASPLPSRWRLDLAAVAAGAVGGAAIGLFESIVFASAYRQYVERWHEIWCVLGTPIWVGTAGGLLLGAVGGALLRRWPWLIALAFLVGSAIPARWRRADLQGGAWRAGAIAALLLLVIVFLLRRSGRAAARRIAIGAVSFVIAFLPIALLALTVARDPEPSFSLAPRVLDHGALPVAAPNIVLVTWDTVRADFLPGWGGGGLDTPNLDQLASEGLLFEHVHAVAPITAPAHLSMLTGLYPIQHGLRSNGARAPESVVPRLPQLLRAAGYATGGFVSNLALMRRHGFDLGMDAFDDRPSASPFVRLLSMARLGSSLLQRLLPADLAADAYQTPGAITLERALRWYAQAARPTFLWTHFYDAHAPYDPQEPFASSTRARAPEGPHAVLPAAERDVIAQRAEIEQLDALLGKLRAQLEAIDPGLAHTMVIVVADHGECFGEGGSRGHHRSVFEATQHVPLVIRFPSSDGADAEELVNRRVPDAVSQIDLLPTICGVVGIAVPAECGGIDLRSLVRGDGSGDGSGGGISAPSRGFYLEAFQDNLGPQRLQAWSEAGWKYVRSLAGTELLLRIDAQGVEQPVDAPERMAALRARLDAFLAEQPASAEGARPPSGAEQEGLRALGYADQ